MNNGQLWLAIAVLASVQTAAGIGVLASRAGQHPAQAAITAAAAFAAALTLAVAIFASLGD